MGQSKKQAKAKKSSRSRQVTVNEDLASQQILAQTVVDTVQAQRDRIRELEAQNEASRKEKTRLEAELSVKSKNVETAPQLATDPNEATLAYAKYLEETVLPKARNSGFSGTGMVMKNGKLEQREITTVKQLEDLIEELKSGAAQIAAGTVGNSSARGSSTGFLSKLKNLVGG